MVKNKLPGGTAAVFHSLSFKTNIIESPDLNPDSSSTYGFETIPNKFAGADEKSRNCKTFNQ